MIFRIFIINKIAFIYVLIMTVILYFVERTRVKKYNISDKNFRKENEIVSGFVGEIVRGARDIKMLNAESSFIYELKNKVVDLNNKRYDRPRQNYSCEDRRGNEVLVYRLLNECDSEPRAA